LRAQGGDPLLMISAFVLALSASALNVRIVFITVAVVAHGRKQFERSVGGSFSPLVVR